MECLRRLHETSHYMLLPLLTWFTFRDWRMQTANNPWRSNKAIFITFGGSLYILDFHFLDLGFFELKHGCLWLVAHDTTSPVLSDFIKSLVEVGLDSLTEVVEVVLVLWANSSEAQCCGCLLVNNLTQPGCINNNKNIYNTDTLFTEKLIKPLTLK